MWPAPILTLHSCRHFSGDTFSNQTCTAADACDTRIRAEIGNLLRHTADGGRVVVNILRVSDNARCQARTKLKPKILARITRLLHE